MHYKVLITTSGIGNRLGELTKYTNKSLVRIGKKPAICYIIDQYPENIELVITLGYYGDQVKDFLNIAYPNRKFSFVNIDKYEGAGSSLLYSMLQAKQYLDCPFIFHACDTIIENENIPQPTYNWLGSYPKTNTSHYRTLNVDNSIVMKLNEKGESFYDFEYIGICGIFDYNLFWTFAEEIYKNDQQNSQLSDCDVIRKIITDKSFLNHIFKNWFDIGNVASLQHARENISDKFELLDKFDESIYILNDSVIKFFHNKDIVKNRILRAEKLNNLVPKIINKSDNFYQYKFADGDLFAQSVTINTFKKFLIWSKNTIWKHVDIENFFDICYDFYINKTHSRINKFLSENNISDKDQIINGIRVPSIENLLSYINIDKLCDGKPVKFHGDYILDNIIETPSGEFVLLDWRQDFGGQINGGDMYYDLSKMNHNLIINHDIVNQNLFDIHYNSDGSITCDILRRHKLTQCHQLLKDFILKNNLDYSKVEILTALIWLNMSPLHHYPLNHFLFHFGKYNLFLALEGK